jgi:dynein heavy chain
MDYEVLDITTATKGPEKGVYVSGLYLEGARWDGSTHLVAESHKKVLYDSLPVLWFKPTLLADFDTKGKYTCPVYKTSARRGVLSTTGHSTNYVIAVQLPTSQPQTHWILRGVAIL